jgi:hypothetical protein
MVFAADYPFLDILGTMTVFFLGIVWLFMVFSVLGRVFTQPGRSALAKVAWTVFIILLPFLGVLVYIGVNSGDMMRRRAADKALDDAQLDAFLTNMTVPRGPV